jgi:hypothetical protein
MIASQSAEAKMAETQAPDRQRWGDPLSYKSEWGERARLAASLVPDNVAILEIGVGTGVLRDLVKDRTAYMGADLQPLDKASITLDLDGDPLPDRRFDYVVLLGVFAYLHRPEAAVKKICDVADHILASYCCRRIGIEPQAAFESGARRGWINYFTHAEFVDLFARHGHQLNSSMPLNATEEFEQFIMEFRRSDLAPRSAGPAPAAAARSV